MRGKYAIAFALLSIFSCVTAWELPNLPSGKRTQYFLQQDDGGYKYGYDTAIDHFAKQAGDANNEVAGHYVYQDANGRAVDVKYTAGINGFIPEGLEKLLPQTQGPSASSQGYIIYRPPIAYPSDATNDQSNTGDASYSFNIDTESYKRQETSDPAGNVQGGYSYTNEAGIHDVSYIAGSNTGFVATSGSLAKPNGLSDSKSLEYIRPQYTSSASRLDQPVNQNGDGSYSFEYSTDDQSKKEHSDANGNVQGRYSYTNEAGTHDLRYVAGSETGFKAIGGSLSVPNGLTRQLDPEIPSTYSSQYASAVEAISDSSFAPVIPNPDASYSFDFTTAHQSRQESADTDGNVQGRYFFTNEAGIHDLSYVAGSQIGFVPTGGSLALPNGLAGKSAPTSVNYAASSEANSYPPTVSNSDGSYSFEYSTGDSGRQENSDSYGNIHGRYYYTNEAGDHDLSYTAGLGIGFHPTSGSLATPNGLSTKTDFEESQAIPQVKHTYIPPTTTYSSETTIDDNNDDEANTGNASYNFSVDTDEYKREESADSDGNVKGYYSYKNKAGTHDLSYAAGSETGFVPTGGSLAQPNGLKKKNEPTIYSYAKTSSEIYLPPIAAPLQTPNNLNLDSGDASYSFSIDTDEYDRKETSDALGNVMGSYSYKNKEGSHDLSYTAGSKTGFTPTGGSLAVPNGITVKKFAGPFASPEYLPPLTRIDTRKANNIVLKQYYPSKSQSKYGYIYESS